MYFWPIILSMNRTIKIELNKIKPIPIGLRTHSRLAVSADEIEINLGQLFLQYYFDSFPTGPPHPDPSRFEYMNLVSPARDFRFHSWVSQASTVKKRSISTEIGQAFCRLLLHDHFGVSCFAHMSELINKPAHAAFGGLKVERTSAGDVPDYLCARESMLPCLAEAKGRFSSIGFERADFNDWRAQFTRIRVVDHKGSPRRVKGYIAATRFVSDANSPLLRTTGYIEDPDTEGMELSNENALALSRGVSALHYAQVFRKLEQPLLATALNMGYTLTRELSLQAVEWTCTVPPFKGRKYMGGFYRTLAGSGPALTEQGWQSSLELGVGHLAFVGLSLPIAKGVAAAARGDWAQLDQLYNINEHFPNEPWPSEFAWLRDGTVAAPAQYFLPTGSVTL
jgi:hypothetical protein